MQRTFVFVLSVSLVIAIVVSLYAQVRSTKTTTNHCPRVYMGFPGIVEPPSLVWETGSEPGGFDGEVIQAVLSNMGCPLKLDLSGRKNNPIKQRFRALEQGTADCVIYQFSVTKKRKTRVAFSRPYTVDGVSLLVGAQRPWHKLSDLPVNPKPKQILVANKGTTGHHWATEYMGSQYTIKENTEIGDVDDCLRSGHCAAFVGDYSALSSVNTRKTGLRVLEDGPYTREPWAIAVRKDDRPLLDRINQALESLESNGTLPRLRKKWNMPSPGSRVP